MSEEFKVTRKASLGGLSFSMEDTAEQGDNRIADHGYPKRDDHYLESMGREADTFNASGHIDVDKDADSIEAFRKVLKSQKEISFFHPFYNRMYRVKIDTWRLSADQKIGRAAVSFRAYKVDSSWQISPVTESSAAAGLAAIGQTLTGDLDNYYQGLAYTATLASDVCDVANLIDATQSLNFEADRVAYRQAVAELGVC